MHGKIHFSAIEIVWTLTFAALLVLLSVLFGRDRGRRFPWFTASIALEGLRMLASRLLFGRLALIRSSEVFLTLADLEAIVSLGVVLELARRAFAGASRFAWTVSTAVIAAVAAVGVILSGPWPAWKTVTAHSLLGHLQLMQLSAQKLDLFDDLLAIELTLLAAFLGRGLNAGWRNHARQILAGLCTASVAQLVVRNTLHRLANAAPPRSQAESLRMTGLEERLINGSSVIYLLVLLWWIACLWNDQPDSGPQAPKPPAALNARPAASAES
jgi:hypothetical protein